MDKSGSDLSFTLLGKEFETKKCGKCVVIGYSGSSKVTVKFYHPEYITKCALSSLRSGSVKNPLVPSVYGVGYVGVGLYSSKDVRLYHLWKAMLARCYSEVRNKDRSTYEGVTVCEEWLNFQNFASWCDGQEFFNAKDDNGKAYHLDKDILVGGNKKYSPETCCFVPPEINSLLLKSGRSRSVLPIGVSANKGNKSFVASIKRPPNKTTLSNFKTVEDAFKAYKKLKESHIKEVADKWKSRVDEKVYNALINHEIKITD